MVRTFCCDKWKDSFWTFLIAKIKKGLGVYYQAIEGGPLNSKKNNGATEIPEIFAIVKCKNDEGILCVKVSLSQTYGAITTRLLQWQSIPETFNCGVL